MPRRRLRFPLVRIDRRSIEPRYRKLEGFLVAQNDELIALHQLDDGYRLDGHTILRRDTIDAIEPLDDDDRRRPVIDTALRLRRQRPKLPRALDLASMRAALVAASEAYDLVTVHHEHLDNEVCEVGRVRLSTATSYVLDPIDPGAQWETPPRRYHFADVTRVDVGSAYELVLASVAAAWGHPRPAGARPPRRPR